MHHKYGPEDVKREFWEELEGVVQNVPQGEKLFQGFQWTY